MALLGVYTMSLFYIFAGLNHFRNPKFYLNIIPPFIKKPKLINLISGALEIFLGVLLLLRPARDLAALGIIILLVSFLPVHIYMLNEAGSKFNKIPKPFLIARIPLQFIFVMWAALYAFPQLGLLPEASSFEVIPHLVYKHSEAQDLTGDLYVPKNGNGKAVVVVHGGSWTSRRGDMTTLCEDLASRGFVAFNIRYRLAPENLYPKSVEDVFDAVQWLRGQAAHYKFNSDRVAGWGYSAGAHLILMAGLNPKSDLYAIVAGGTPSDFSLYPFSPLIRKYLGVTFQINPQLWREASPINHVSENPPPVFMYHGQWDILVSPEQMYVMEKELKSHHGRVETFLAPYMGHLATYFFSGLYFDRVVNFLNQ